MNNNSINYLEIITDHIKKYIGKIETVNHEFQSDLLPIDIFYIPPKPKHPWHTHITYGMSNITMNVPPNSQLPKFAELILYLPPNRPISEKDNYIWPLEMLRLFARYPYYENKYLAHGNAIKFGVHQEFYSPNTDFQGVLIYYSLLEDKNFSKLKIDNDVAIHFYNVFPLYKEEFDIYHQSDLDNLLAKFNENEIECILDDSRINVGL